MGTRPLHVIFGAGQVGLTLARHLARAGHDVRSVSRRRPSTLDDTVDWTYADVTDVESAADAAKGASVVYQCLNVPYTQWPELFPPLQRNMLAVAERTEALLVTLENVYGYGPTAGRPLTEDLPLVATTSKGRARAAMSEELLAAHHAGRVRATIGRASDFFGPGVRDSALGERVFANAVAAKRADFLGNPHLAHSYSYVPDVAAGLATLGCDERSVGQAWHLPGPETTTTRAVLDLVATEVGHEVGVRSLPRPILRALGLFNPMMRELVEMLYEFEEPFVLDVSKFTSVFGPGGTPMASAVADTVAWYKAQGSE